MTAIKRFDKGAPSDFENEWGMGQFISKSSRIYPFKVFLQSNVVEKHNKGRDKILARLQIKDHATTAAPILQVRGDRRF